MEYFFYNDKFYHDIDDLIEDVCYWADIDDVDELEDGWKITCEETTLEKMFVITKEFAVDAIVDKTDKWEERFPEENDFLFKQIEQAISDSIDIDKLNEGIPSLYYPNGKNFVITKNDLKQ